MERPMAAHRSGEARSSRKCHSWDGTNWHRWLAVVAAEVARTLETAALSWQQPVAAADGSVAAARQRHGGGAVAVRHLLSI
mmetsp:Transcript_95899/g.273429  ORF Transcript_95899/g.273429 Transcript_95899/m.273429 type:complete len:81 (-) Transcript_95899:447-689(-)